MLVLDFLCNTLVKHCLAHYTNVSSALVSNPPTAGAVCVCGGGGAGLGGAEKGYFGLCAVAMPLSSC